MKVSKRVAFLAAISALVFSRLALDHQSNALGSIGGNDRAKVTPL